MTMDTQQPDESMNHTYALSEKKNINYVTGSLESCGQTKYELQATAYIVCCLTLIPSQHVNFGW
jgi:hypothetical protein